MVSLIVPARNEEACLGACLQSLSSQVGVSFEIIVVDDGSIDRTPEIARSFPAVRVVHPGPLPPGWTGKNNALVAGAKEARGEWLLFTDADTVHRAGSLVRSVAEARERGAALLSYSPEQEVHGIWEKAIMPVIFAELASTYRPSEVSDPASPAAAANGQYILISREAYDAVGGHAAVATSLLEDVVLARAVKASGRKLFFRYGGDSGANADVSQFCSTEGGLDEESGPPVSVAGGVGIVAADRICADRRQRWPDCRLGSNKRSNVDVGRDWNSQCYSGRVSPQTNPQGIFFLGCKLPGADRVAGVLISLVPLENRLSEGKRLMEGKAVRSES